MPQGWNDGAGLTDHGLRLTALTVGTSHTTAVETFDDWEPPAGSASRCSANTVSTPTAAGNHVGRISYGWPEIAAGATKTVTFLYRRF